MTKEEYKFLIKNKFITPYFGNLCSSIYDFADPDDFVELYKKVEPIMLKQLTDDFDIKNCIIISPINTLCGNNYLWNNHKIVDSHCTDVVKLRYKLHEIGMKEYDGKSLLDNIQKQTAMFIIDNGVVYCSSGGGRTAFPLTPFYLTPDKRIDEKLLENKSIFFSGFILKRLENN